LPLKLLKESSPVEVAQYAKANQIDAEPAFDWWVDIVLKRAKRIIKGAQSRHQRVGYKFGIELPQNGVIADAMRIDKKNGNTLWMDALRKEMRLRKEMSAVMVAFDVQPEGTEHVPGYKKITGHVVLDVKMDFTRKARYVVSGHRTDPPKAITYSSVVSRALNDLDICLTNIGNAYLTAPVTEQYYVVAGDKFGPELKGKDLKIVRALYGLKSACAAFRAHLASVLRDHLGFTGCQADGDVWMRKARKPGGDFYYEYALVYVDDVMLLSSSVELIIGELKEHFTIKVVEDPSVEPCRYLGGMIGQYTHEDGSTSWYILADDYCRRPSQPWKKNGKRSCRRESVPSFPTSTIPSWM
jgi:hypothetical protein